MNETSRVLELLARLRAMPAADRAAAFYEVLRRMPADALAPSAELLAGVPPRHGEDDQLIRLWAVWISCVEGDRRAGRALLEELSRGLFYLAEPHLLVGLAALLDGDRGGAVRAFRRGVRVDPGFAPLYDLLRDFGLRQPPVLSFLRRDHALNFLLGRWRARWYRFREGARA